MKNASKRTLGMVLATALSVAVFATTAMAASRNVSGYEKVRESVFRYYDELNKSQANFTVNAGFKVRLDGEEVLSAEAASAQQDRYNSNSANSYTVGGITFSDEYSYNDGISLRYDNVKDTYYMSGSQIEHDDDFDGDYNVYSSEMSSNQRRLLGVLFDMFAGDAKNYCYLDGDVITCRLERSQIPEFFQALIAVVSEQVAPNMSGYAGTRIEDFSSSDYLSVDDALGSSLITVVNNASFESVDCRGIIDENDLLNDVTADVTITGNDADGKPHTVTITITGKISDIGTTVAAPLDTAGKRVVDNTWTLDEYDYSNDLYLEDGTVDFEQELREKRAGSGLLDDMTTEELRELLDDPATLEKLNDLLGDDYTDIIDAESDILDDEALDLFGGDLEDTAAQPEPTQILY